MGGQGEVAKWAARAVIALGVTIAGCGDGHSGGSGAGQAPALIVEGSHDAARTLDVLRLIFVPSSVQVATPGCAGRGRVFVTARWPQSTWCGNATLSAGGCRCIRVAPYEGRGMDPLDPDFIRQQGGLGECRSVARLRFAG